MKCPKCNETLVMADRQGIEIDYCPNCRGVWLDRGELDKIIERSAAYTMGPEPNQYREEPKPYREEPKYYDQPKYPPQGGHYNDPHYKHKKKKGFLSDFFDFD
ncbi:MAG TPA: zf-TFIIB domain-containing protein [Chitinophagaceae bacterium]